MFAVVGTTANWQNGGWEEAESWESLCWNPAGEFAGKKTEETQDPQSEQLFAIRGYKWGPLEYESGILTVDIGEQMKAVGCENGL